MIRKIDNAAWMKVRKAELVQTRGIIQQNTQPVQAQQSENSETREALIATNKVSQENEGARQKMLNVLEKQGELGMDIDVLIQASETAEEEAEKIIEDLIKEGEIYMSRPGILKII